MKKKSIAIFHCGFIYSGGGERIILEEAKGLKKRGFEVGVFAPTLDEKRCFPEEVKELGVKTFFPQLPGFLPARAALLMVLSSLLAPFFAWRFKKYDLFIGANQPGAWIAYLVSKALGKSYIVYLNQPNRLLYPRDIDEVVKWQNLKEYYFIDKLIKKLRLFVSWADFTSFTSSVTMLVNGDYIGKIIQDIYQKPVVVCPAGCHPSEEKMFKLDPTSNYYGQFVIKNLAGKNFILKRPYILITNRHEPQKKFEYGLEALAQIIKKFPAVSLVIPGPATPHTAKLVKLAKKLNVWEKVIFTGQISEGVLQQLYQNAVVYIYTAPEEDFGMGIIEAMAWGVPVVAWGHGGPTVTMMDGKTGYLAKPYDLLDFARKISLLLEDPQKRQKMSKFAWQHVKNNFSWDKHLDILEQEIVNCLKKI